ncbi:hypothetical protein H0O00_04615 [Candidatus Micrarchaeota archaeon]|nr:hypothetical protein [Candidatus Micrarchaeota archaeon]
MAQEKTLDQLIKERQARKAKPKLPVQKPLVEDHDKGTGEDNGTATRAIPATTSALAASMNDADTGRIERQEPPKAPATAERKPRSFKVRDLPPALAPKPVPAPKDETSFADVDVDVKAEVEPPKAEEPVAPELAAQKSPSEPPVYAEKPAEPEAAAKPKGPSGEDDLLTKVKAYVDSAVDQLNERLDQLKSTVDGLKSAVDRFNSTSDEVAQLNTRLDEIKSTVDKDHEAINSIGNDVAGEFDEGNLIKEGLNDRVDALEERTDALEERSVALEERSGAFEEGMTQALQGVHEIEVKDAVGPLTILLLKSTVTNDNVKEAVDEYGKDVVKAALENLARVEGYAKAALMQVRVHELDTPEKLAGYKGLMDTEVSKVVENASLVLLDFNAIVGEAQSDSTGGDA